MGAHDADLAAIERMIEDIRRIRERTCDPKSNKNPRYLALSSAVSGLRKAADHLRTDSRGCARAEPSAQQR